MKTSQYEKKVWAEFNTPQYLIDKMLNILPATFWQTPKKIWEPCCSVLCCNLKLFFLSRRLSRLQRSFHRPSHAALRNIAA